jgi:hypothetical protein
MGQRTRRWGTRAGVAASLTLAVAGNSLLAGCVTITQGVDASDTQTLELPVSPGTPVHVETFNGGISVSPATDGLVSASVVRTGHGGDAAAAEADRDAIQVTLALVDGAAELRATYLPDPHSIPSGTGADVTLHVPAEAALALQTSNGPVDVDGATNGLQVRTSNAPVELQRAAGDVSVVTSNGRIQVDAAAPLAIEAHTSNAPITLEGPLLPGDHVLETSNARVDVRPPGDAAFTIDARTSNADVSSQLDVLEEGSGDGSLRGTIGAPDVAAGTTLTIRTSNAPVTLQTQ